jgi:hypothetical protein
MVDINDLKGDGACRAIELLERAWRHLRRGRAKRDEPFAALELWKVRLDFDVVAEYVSDGVSILLSADEAHRRWPAQGLGLAATGDDEGSDRRRNTNNRGNRSTYDDRLRFHCVVSLSGWMR